MAEGETGRIQRTYEWVRLSNQQRAWWDPERQEMFYNSPRDVQFALQRNEAMKSVSKGKKGLKKISEESDSEAWEMRFLVEALDPPTPLQSPVPCACKCVSFREMLRRFAR